MVDLFNIYLQVQLILWGIAVALLCIVIYLYVRKFRKIEKDKSTYVLSLAIFFLCFAIYVILKLYYSFFLDGGLIGLGVQDLGEIAYFFWVFNFCMLAVATIFIIFAVEKEVYTKLKFGLTIFFIGTFVIFLIMVAINSELARYISWISSLGGIIVPLLYLYVGIKSAGEPRANSLKMFLSLFLIMFSHLIFTRFFWEVFNLTPNWGIFDISQFFLTLAPIFMILGAIIIISLERKTWIIEHNKYERKNLTFYYFLVIFSTI